MSVKNISAPALTTQQHEHLVNVYPNPTNSWLHIERNNTDAIQIALHDNLGRCLLSKTSNQSLTQLDLSDLMPGMYYLSVKDGKKQTSFKVLRR